MSVATTSYILDRGTVRKHWQKSEFSFKSKKNHKLASGGPWRKERIERVQIDCFT